MKALAKVVGLVVFGVVVLGIGILFFLTRLFDPNDYKDYIQQAARDKANVELTLSGDIGWSLFPWLGIELKQVGVAPLEQPDQPLAEVGSLGLGVEVLPLLRRQLRMSDVILDSVSLNLVRNEQGVGNWETIGASGDQASAPADEPATPPTDQPSSTAGDLDIAIDSVRITNARVRYSDLQAGQNLLLEDVNLSTGALIEGQPFDLAFLGLLVSDAPALRTRIDLQAVAQFDLGLQRYELQGLNLKLDASGEPFSGRAVNLQLQADSVVDLTAQVAELSQIRLALADLRATGELRASHLDSDMRLVGSLNVAEFDARALIRSLGQTLPETADSQALQKVALAARINGSANSLMLENLKLILDGSELSGNLGLADFERQALRFSLAGPRLNLDNYLPPAEPDSPSTGSGGQGGSRSDTPPEPWSTEPVLPLSTLAELDIDGSLDLQEVVLTGQTINAFKAAVTARNGRIQLKQFEGEVFGGQFAVNADIDARRSPVSLKLGGKLAGIDSLALQQAYDAPAQVRGRLDMNLDLAASGNSMDRWMSTLNGNAGFNVADGALLGVNLEQQLCQAIALANRKTLAAARGAEDTPFTRLGGSFRIENGQVSNDDLVAALPGISAKGRGNVQLPEQRLDYRLGLQVEGDKSDMPDPTCQVNQRYVDIEWPLRCRGYLHNAASSCGVDTDGVGRIAARLLGNEAQRKVEERLEEKLGDQAPAVRDAIRGLFNR